MTIAENITAIKAKIGSAQLVAVSKNHPAESVEEAIKAGQYIFGENRVQEAQGKFPALKAKYPDLKLHLIGPLQTNKVKDALKLFDVIQTLDREKLANAFAKEAAKQEMFIQVNIGNEPQKAGIALAQTIEFFKFCKEDLRLNVTGLMCIPPANEPATPYFTELKNLSLQLATYNLQLSMGMSGDYEEAVKAGADYVRIGTAIFGERKY